HQAGRAVARVYLGISAALVLGVPLGTVAATSVGWRGSFLILAVLSLALAFMTWRFMPKLAASPKEAPGHHQSDLLKDPRFLLHIGLSIVVFTAMFTAYTYLADILERVAGIHPTYVGWWLMGFGLVGLIGNWLGGVAADRSALLSTLFFTILLAAAMLLIVPVAQSHWFLAFTLMLWGISYTGLFPICQIRVMEAGGTAQALAATVNVSAANAGAGIGAIAGGLVIDHWQIANLGYASASIGLLAIIYAMAMLSARKPSKNVS
ncbi:MAG: MFS transporter, partial [Gammaproteobacteria bacterium]|nr:MFS transporter [Gammaproteobacteria bacterium]